MSETFTEQSIEKAVLYLAESSAKYGKARGLVTWLEHKLKIVEATHFAEAEGNIEERKSKARMSDDYKTAVEQYRDAITEAETLRAYRAAAESRIEVWRSLEASKRSVNIQ